MLTDHLSLLASHTADLSRLTLDAAEYRARDSHYTIICAFNPSNVHHAAVSNDLADPSLCSRWPLLRSDDHQLLLFHELAAMQEVIIELRAAGYVGDIAVVFPTLHRYFLRSITVFDIENLHFYGSVQSEDPMIWLNDRELQVGAGQDTPRLSLNRNLHDFAFLTSKSAVSASRCYLVGLYWAAACYIPFAGPFIAAAPFFLLVVGSVAEYSETRRLTEKQSIEDRPQSGAAHEAEHAEARAAPKDPSIVVEDTLWRKTSSVSACVPSALPADCSVTARRIRAMHCRATSAIHRIMRTLTYALKVFAQSFHI